MSNPEEFLPYDVLALRGGTALSIDVRQRLRTWLPDWVEFCIDTQAVADHTMMGVGPVVNNLEQINYVDRQRADFYQMRLAAFHANTLLLSPNIAMDSPRDLIQTPTSAQDSLWDKLARTEFQLWEKLDQTAAETIKAHRQLTQQDELLLVTAVRLLILDPNADIDKSIPAYLHDQTKGIRSDVYHLAQSAIDEVRKAQQAPDLAANAFARLTRARLFALHQGKPWSKEQFLKDIEDAVKIDRDKSPFAAIKKRFFYPKALKGKIQNSTTDRSWHRDTAVFESELDNLLTLLQEEKENGNSDDRLKALASKDPATEELLFKQYYHLLTQNPQIISLK